MCVCVCRCVFVPADHPAEILRGSFLPGACRDDGCAESPGSQCRCPEPETEPSGPPVDSVLPLCDSTAAAAPKHVEYKFSSDTQHGVLAMTKRQVDSDWTKSTCVSSREAHMLCCKDIDALTMKFTKEFLSFSRLLGIHAALSLEQ